MKNPAMNRITFWYITLAIFIFIVILFVLYPRNLHCDEWYANIKEVAYSAIDDENNTIQKVELPENVQLTVKQTQQATTITTTYLVPTTAFYINYTITLSPEHTIVEQSPEIFNIRNYMIQNILIILLLGFVLGFILPFPILFLYAIIHDYVFPHIFSHPTKTNTIVRSKGTPTIDRW